MCERTFLHSSACVLRSPCGEARRASLLAPLGRFADKPNLSVGFTASRPSGKPRTKTVISAARRKQVFYTEERFADKPNLRLALSATLNCLEDFPRSAREISIVCCACFAAHKSQNRLFCEFYSSLRSLKERCSLRSHKGQNLCFLWGLLARALA
jgi:hypothetical protein